VNPLVVAVQQAGKLPRASKYRQTTPQRSYGFPTGFKAIHDDFEPPEMGPLLLGEQILHLMPVNGIQIGDGVQLRIGNIQ